MADSGFEISLAGYTFDPAVEQPDIPAELRSDANTPDSQRYIIQFNKALSREEQARIQREYGLQLSEYIPQFAYLEQLRQDTRERLLLEPLVRAIVVLEPAFKISPGIGQITFRKPERQALQGLLLQAILFPEADPEVVESALERAGATNISVLDDRPIGGVTLVRFVAPSRNLLAEVAPLPEVQWIEEVAESNLDNGFTAGTIQSGTPGTETVWDHGIRGERQIIGIIDGDTLDMNHCWFMDNVNNTPSPAHRKVVGLRNAGGAGVGRHPTFVAGIAAGDDVNNPGGDANRGIAWAARMTFGNQDDIDNGLATMFAYLVAAMNDGAAIHSNSWHEEPGTYNQTARDVDRFVWNNEDNLVVGSAGNALQTPPEEIGPPGTAKNALCVAASERHPNHMNLGDGNPGPTIDTRPRRKPEIVAPGCQITSADDGTACGTNVRGCATSWATPAISAAAAMVRQYFVEGWYPTGTQRASDGFTPSGALLKATLLNSTVDMKGVDWNGNTLTGYPGDLEGWGRVRLDQSLYFAGDIRKLWIRDRRRANGLFFGQTATHRVVVATNAAPLRVTLVWSDPPGQVNANDPVVNNLDLEVRSPDGAQTFLGNHFANGVSATGGVADDRNNVEMVLINNPAPGEWRITVRATAVSIFSLQGYALVVSGDLAGEGGPVGVGDGALIEAVLHMMMQGSGPSEIRDGAPIEAVLHMMMV